MSLMTVYPSPSSLQEAISFRDNTVWQALASVTVSHAIDDWLATLSYQTQRAYRGGINVLASSGLLNIFLDLQAFALINHNAIVDRIKLLPVAETTRQARAACYISFTTYLSRRFPGVFSKATANREGNAKTFYRVHEKVTTEAMNQAQWTVFLEALASINRRDSLIAKLALQGGKRIGEVLVLHIEQIDWEKRRITFTQSKTRGTCKETVITCPSHFLADLKAYLSGRTSGLVFLSSKGNAVCLNQVANTFAKAGYEANIPFKVTPHVLRATAVTYLKQQGFADSDIMKVTGHASAEMVHAYDKSDRANNATQRVSLI